jgi:hypothetical protein
VDISPIKAWFLLFDIGGKGGTTSKKPIQHQGFVWYLTFWGKRLVVLVTHGWFSNLVVPQNHWLRLKDNMTNAVFLDFGVRQFGSIWYQTPISPLL